MKINQATAIATGKALLVPYEAHHVLTYHAWMQDPASSRPRDDIQQATASEPLTLEEEYENQQSWRLAHDKLTFIVCAPDAEAGPRVVAGREDADERMRGDVNFFLHAYQDDGDEEQNEAKGWLTGEVDVMIAGTSHRRQGLGRAAVCALLVYIDGHLPQILREHDDAADAEGAASRPSTLRGLMVKIQEGNAASRSLFRSLGFEQQGEVNYFGEVMMAMPWEALRKQVWWDGAVADYREVEYEVSVKA